MPEVHLCDYQGIMGQRVGYSQEALIMVEWYFQISLGLTYGVTQIEDLLMAIIFVLNLFQTSMEF